MADGTQYLIELSAKFSGGDAAVATLADLGDRMLAAGASAESLEKTAKAMAVSMEESAAAVTSANAALTEGEAKYRAAEVAADRAAKAVERIGVQMQAQEGKLQKALDTGDTEKITAAENAVWALAIKEQELAAAAETAKSALEAEAEVIDDLKSNAAAAGKSHDDLKKGLTNVKGATEAAQKAAGTGKLNDIAGAMGKLGGPVGQAGQKVLGLAEGFKKLGTAMGSAGPYVAVGLAIAAMAVAAIAATVAITQWGVSMADANRTQGLMMDGIARSSEGGAQLAATIDNLSSQVPATREELMKMAGTLADSGLRGDELSEALETAAIKAARLKFGPDFEEEMLSLSFQSKRLGENLQATFGGLKIDGLLKGLRTLGALFDESTESGKALKFLFESMFQPLVNGATGVIPKIERVFLYAVLLALEAYIALKPYKTMLESIGKTLLIGSAILIGVFAVALGIVIAVIGLLYYMIADLVEVLYDLTVAFYGVEAALLGLIADAWNGAVEMVAQMIDFGVKLVDGLIEGVKSRGGAIIDAMTGVVKGGVAAVEKFLHIGSPSKLMMDIGANTAEGFTGGVEDGAGGAQGALEAMVAPPTGTATAMSGAAGGAAIVIQQMIVNGETAKELAQDFIEQVTRLLEGDARSLGGGEVAHA